MSLGSTFAKNADLKACYGDNKSTAAGWPTSITVKLYVGDPTAGGVEMSGGGYAGVVLANTTAVLGTPSAGQLGPIAVVWPASSGAWSSGTPPTYGAFVDGSGNILDYGIISANPGVTAAGQVFELDVTIAST